MEKLPAAHYVHADELVALASAEYVPAVQLVHDEDASPLKVPAMHVRHDEVPASEYVPF